MATISIGNWRIDSVQQPYAIAERPTNHRGSIGTAYRLLDETRKSGDVITEYAVRSVRPGNGLPPKYIGNGLGRAVGKDVPVHAMTPVTRDSVALDNGRA